MKKGHILIFIDWFYLINLIDLHGPRNIDTQFVPKSYKIFENQSFRKVPESILKNPYNSLPRGSAGIVREEPFEWVHLAPTIIIINDNISIVLLLHCWYDDNDIVMFIFT